MSVNPEGDALLPVACTLGAADGSQRLDEWRRVAAAAGTGRQVVADAVRLTFADEPGIGETLQALVAAERECCSFLGWHLAHVDGEWRLDVQGGEDELRSLSILL